MVREVRLVIKCVKLHLGERVKRDLKPNSKKVKNQEANILVVYQLQSSLTSLQRTFSTTYLPANLLSTNLFWHQPTFPPSYLSTSLPS